MSVDSGAARRHEAVARGERVSTTRGGRDPLKVLVAGAGAIGQWLGLRLMQAGHDVTLLVRPHHAEAIRRAGLRVHGATQMHGHPLCITSPTERLGKYDAILLSCKAHQTAALAPQVAPLLEGDGAFATVQNGFGNAQKMAHALGGDASRIVVVPLTHGVMVEQPGLLLHAGGAGAVVGPFVPRAEPAARRTWNLLDDAGLSPEWTDDVRGHVWRKGLLNHAVNPVGAIHGQPNGKLLRGPAWEQCKELADEGYMMARSAGVALPGKPGLDGLVEAMRTTLERSAANRNSMLADIEAQRPTEVEQISGRLVRLSRRLGIAAPQTDEVYRNVKALETRYLGEGESLRRVRDEVSWETGPF